MADLLVEIGTEELPARKVREAAEALRDGLARGLAGAGLLDGWKPEGQPVLGTPRRLAAFVPGVKERQPDREERAWGPPVAAATGPDGKPTKAGEGFARTAGVAFADLKRGEKVAGKPPYVYADRVVKGRSAAEVVADLLPKVAASLPFRRTMRWPQSDMPFARPIRNLVVLLGSSVVPCRVAGVEAGRTTRGHAFLKPKPIEVPGADLAEYVALLKKAKVLVDIEERASEIEKQVRRARAGVLGSGRKGPWTEADDELLSEVGGLVEWPRSLVGSFDAAYRDLPPSLLVTTMAHHLRYFPIAGEDGRPRGFVSVTDREERHADSIREGNERVLRARLYDAAFFFANDRKKRLEEFRPALAGVDFHKGLGTLLDKSERVRRIAVSLCDTLKLSPEVRAHADRAAFLLKCDLLTEVVKEFPELQGKIGAHYARLAGEPPAVADAVESQYLPAGIDLGRVARERGAAAVVCLAERADSLVSYFSIGEEPTGSADPFGLRRAALALLVLLEKSGWPLSIQEVLRIAGDVRVQRPTDESMARLKTFLWTRVEFMARSRPEGYVDFVDSVGETADRPLEQYWARLGALASLKTHDDWVDLIALVERTGNMGARSDAPSAVPQSPPEVANVDRALQGLKRQIGTMPMARADELIKFADRYVKTLGAPVATMFEKVLVDDPKEPARRAAIKGMLHEIFVLFADRLGDLRRLGSGARPPRG